MAINLRCDCGGETKLTTKICGRCGKSFPKKDRKYKVTVRYQGKKRTGTYTNLELAREIESKWKTEIARGVFGVQREPQSSIGEVWEKFLPWAKQNKKSWKSDEYVYSKHLKPRFARKRLDKISQFDVEKLMLEMKKGRNKHGRQYAPATIKHAVVLLSRLYSVAGQWALYPGDNPCSRIKMPVLNNQVTEFLNPEELSNLHRTLDTWPDQRSAAFIRFLLYTGLRRGEVFALKWNDIDFENQIVTLHDPKGKIDQQLPLSDKATDCLRALPKTESDYVFPGKKGGRRVEFKKPWIAIKKAAGLSRNFRLHGLRHHFASSLVSAGTDLYTVSKLLTHKDIKTTQRYAHLADKALRDAVQLSDELHDVSTLKSSVNIVDDK